MAPMLTLPVQAFAFASLLVASTYLYRKLYHRRFTINAHIPQLPSSLIWGHLVKFHEFTQKGAVDRHPDEIFSDMHKALGKPPIMVVDNWPIVSPMVIVASHEVAEQLSRPSSHLPYSAMKAPVVARISDLIGSNSMLIKQGEDWKQVRKRFNPGFAPQHLMTLLPVILDKAKLYLNVLDSFVSSKETFSLDQITTSLTFDIIGKVIMGEDMMAQPVDVTRKGELYRVYGELTKTYEDDKLQLPWWLLPRTYLKRHRLGEKIADKLKHIIRQRFEAMKDGSQVTESRSVLALSLSNISTLTPGILDETCDQLKTFLFAGHDTTSSTITWMIYELSRTPHALKGVRDELDRLFGPGRAREPTFVRDALLGPGGSDIIRQMTYTSAVMKEVLRLHPPTGSIRMSEPGAGCVVDTPQGKYNLDGNWIYLNQLMIHRDAAVYGDTANELIPERWLGNSNVPAGAWRAFETGPRHCIGQELATIELRVIIALVSCRYDFSKVGLGEPNLDGKGRPILGSNGQFAVKSELYSIIQITGKAVDRMMMKVELAQ